MRLRAKQKSPTERAFLNADHANWLELPQTKQVIEDLYDLISAQQRYTVDGRDAKEKVYALALENIGLRKALDMIETLPFPIIERNQPNGDE